MSDAELVSQLRVFHESVVPVTPSTRELLERRLAQDLLNVPEDFKQV